MNKGIREEVRFKRVLEKITRPNCFGVKSFCVNHTCEHRKDCDERFAKRTWLAQAIEMKAHHERKAKYFEKKIEKLKAEGIFPFEEF